MKEDDIWRDSLLRYLGYANEVGESFRPIAPRLVVPSYVVAFGYVLGDTFDKATKTHNEAVAGDVPSRKRNVLVATATVDTLAWQTLASVVIPGFTINRVVAVSSFAVQKAVKNSPVVRRWAPTAIGLGVIPLIIHPIDSLVDWAMDNTVRKLLAAVSIVRIISTSSTDSNISWTPLYSLIIQRPRFVGGLLKIPLDVTVQLTQCSTKDIAQNIIRLRYGPKGKHLAMRAANISERKQWITALSNCLTASHAAKSTASSSYRTTKVMGMSTNLPKTATAIPQGRHNIWRTLDRASSFSEAVPPLPLYSLDAIKRLAEGYDYLAQQWAQVAMETRQFHVEINGLQPPCVASEHTAVCYTAY
ncbi:Mitochondrial fission process protein 1 [Phytophthora citrophthora]|uniref:Mitochondrial fission process protein 1 n=1 Tax=Phytophthora citrophthora TaxID=4793 RepID=A0AAD9H1I3_9STRA|nr:Mitochondrial fission process protein 1 [Phytophthora citrophthora]